MSASGQRPALAALLTEGVEFGYGCLVLADGESIVEIFGAGYHHHGHGPVSAGQQVIADTVALPTPAGEFRRAFAGPRLTIFHTPELGIVRPQSPHAGIGCPSLRCSRELALVHAAHIDFVTPARVCLTVIELRRKLRDFAMIRIACPGRLQCFLSRGQSSGRQCDCGPWRSPEAATVPTVSTEYGFQAVRAAPMQRSRMHGTGHLKPARRHGARAPSRLRVPVRRTIPETRTSPRTARLVTCHHPAAFLWSAPPTWLSPMSRVLPSNPSCSSG